MDPVFERYNSACVDAINSYYPEGVILTPHGFSTKFLIEEGINPSRFVIYKSVELKKSMSVLSNYSAVNISKTLSTIDSVKDIEQCKIVNDHIITLIFSEISQQNHKEICEKIKTIKSSELIFHEYDVTKKTGYYVALVKKERKKRSLEDVQSLMKRAKTYHKIREENQALESIILVSRTKRHELQSDLVQLRSKNHDLETTNTRLSETIVDMSQKQKQEIALLQSKNKDLQETLDEVTSFS